MKAFFARKALWWNLAAFAILTALLYWLWPELLHRWFFQRGLLLWPFFLIAGGLLWIVYKLGFLNLEGSWTSRAVSIMTALTFFGGSVVTMYVALQNYGVYLYYADFTPRTEHVVSSSEQYRFTPRRVAYRIMNDSVNDAAQNIEPDYTLPIIFPDGFGYAAPLTPEGIIPTFTDAVQSVMVYEDRPGVTGEDRRHRIDIEFKVAPGLQWFDALDRKLVLNDFFTVYDDPHLLAWNPEDRDDLVFAVPMIKYRFFLLPYWAGVTIVEPDGTLTTYTPEEIRQHERLKTQWTYPSSLALTYVKSQNFGCDLSIALACPFVQVSGKLETYKYEVIEPDAGSSASDMDTNQQPFLEQGADGIPYLVISTKSEGGGSGIFRVYYVNAATGESTVLEYADDASLYGPEPSMAPVKTLDYNWRREAAGNVSGNIVVVEPVKLVRPTEPGVFYWKGSVTPTNFRDVSGTVVAPADKPQDFLFFRSRETFEAWLAGDDSVGHIDDAVVVKFQQLMSVLDEVRTDGDELEQMLEQLINTK